MFRLWVSLPANPCPILVAFQDPEIQLALDRCFRNPAHKLTALRTSVSLGGPAWFLDMFYWQVLATQWSLFCAGSLHLTQDKYCRKLDFTVEGSQMHTDIHRRTQTNVDECGRTKTNADERRRTVFGVWSDATSRRVQTLDICSRTFGTYYSYSFFSWRQQSDPPN